MHKIYYKLQIPCPTCPGTSFSLKRKTIARRQLVAKGCMKSFKSQKFVFQFTFDHFQPFLREIQGQFGLQLIRGIPNSKNAWRIHDDDDGDDDDDDDNLQYNDDHSPSF
jgi:hypothetical protein